MYNDMYIEKEFDSMINSVSKIKMEYYSIILGSKKYIS